MSRAYYSEFDPFAAAWLRNLIAAGHIAPGDVDERSIMEVTADDIKGYTQCHFFAGIGGWSYAARLAGWPDDRPLWTGSCPCQPFSAAGKQAGRQDERHLWPAFYRLIRERRPDVVMGEQVAAAIGFDWLSGVCDDLEAIGYDIGAAVIPACAVNAPHRRDRLWFVADAASDGRQQGKQTAAPSRHRKITASESSASVVADANRSISGQVGAHARRGEGGNRAGQQPGSGISRHGAVANAIRNGRGEGRDDHAGHYGAIAPATGHVALGFADGIRRAPRLSAPHGRYEGLAEIPDDGGERRLGAWGEYCWLIGADGKVRRVKSGLPLLANGISGRVAVRRTVQQGGTSHEEEHWYSRVGALRGFGNAIVPQVAAEVMRAYMGFNS